jgi:hypothetical protein
MMNAGNIKEIEILNGCTAVMGEWAIGRGTLFGLRSACLLYVGLSEGVKWTVTRSGCFGPVRAVWMQTRISSAVTIGLPDGGVENIILRRRNCETLGGFCGVLEQTEVECTGLFEVRTISGLCTPTRDGVDVCTCGLMICSGVWWRRDSGLTLSVDDHCSYAHSCWTAGIHRGPRRTVKSPCLEVHSGPTVTAACATECGAARAFLLGLVLCASTSG